MVCATLFPITATFESPADRYLPDSSSVAVRNLHEDASTPSTESVALCPAYDTSFLSETLPLTYCTPGRLFIIFASFSVRFDFMKLTVCPGGLPGPNEALSAPGTIVMISVPNCPRVLMITTLKASPMDIMRTIVATPMTIPMIVSQLLSCLFEMLFTARVRMSSVFTLSGRAFSMP